MAAPVNFIKGEFAGIVTSANNQGVIELETKLNTILVTDTTIDVLSVLINPGNGKNSMGYAGDVKGAKFKNVSKSIKKISSKDIKKIFTYGKETPAVVNFLIGNNETIVDSASKLYQMTK